MRKFTKRAVSLAVASFVTVTSVFAGSSINANAATTSILATTNQSDTYKVTFTAPSDWTGTVYAYAYYTVADGTGSRTKKEPLQMWPGTAMTKNSDGTYSINVDTTEGYTRMIFANVTESLSDVELKYDETNKQYYYDFKEQLEQIPEDPKDTTVEGGAYVTSDCTISSTGVVTKATPAVTPTTEPTKTPEVTATPVVTKEPTAAPTVTPVSGPQVTVSEPNGTSYYEETNDTLSVVLDLAEGATSATYSVDNGPETTITGKTIVTLGEGKIANSEISLKVTSTDGTTTNTQEFTYFKKSKASETATKTSKKSVSATMVSLFSTVKTLATTYSNAKELPVHFQIPGADWAAADCTVYCYAYYVDPTTNRIERPLGIWPGKPMVKNTSTGYYERTVDAPTGAVSLVFSSIKGGLGTHYNEGALLQDGSRAKEEHWSGTIKYKLPDGCDKNGNFAPGYTIDSEAWFAMNAYDNTQLTLTSSAPVSPIPSTASPTPTVPASTKPGDETGTPDPSKATATPEVSTELNGYFGASLSAPQYNTASKTLSAVALNATGDVTYSFYVDGEEVYTGSNSVIDWDTTKLTEGKHEISAKITDGEGNVWTETKNYTIAVDGSVIVDPTATPEVTVEPTEEPTATPEVTTEPTEEPTATPEVTEEPTVEPTVVPTAVPTVVPTTVPAITLDNNASQNPAQSVTGGAVTSTGSIKITFSKKNKTAGETIKVKATVAGVDEVYKLSYAVKKTGGKTKTLAKKVNKKTVSWTPTTKGTYTVTVKAYSEDGKVLATGTTKYKVKKRVITISSIKPASTKVGKATTIKIKGKTTKGKLKIKVVIKNKKGKTVKTKKYSKKKTFTWKPTKKGTYTIKVTAKNGKGVVVSKTKKIKVKK